MTTNNNEKTVFLASSDDQDAWYRQFKAKVIAAGLQDQIQGTTPFLIEPNEPNPLNHEYKTPSQLTASSSTITEDIQTQRATTTPATTTLVVRATINDLTTNGWKTYNIQYTVY